MLNTNNLAVNSNLSNSQFSEVNSNILKKNSPSCIVIGCKNAYPNSAIKYYQVPDISESEVIENNISRQWYINTLREDLLDFILSNNKPIINKNVGYNVSKQPHFVCIEHFDEESFAVHEQNLPGNEQFLLKEDAVPSLFEIEVFQKMIAHQEQIALNQQKQAQIQNKPVQTQQHGGETNFLSNLILNNGKSQNQDVNAFNTPTSGASKVITSQQKSSNFLPQNSPPTTSTQTPIAVSNKRVRMDPNTRAALIQRVPKAVKRTSCVANLIPQNPAMKSMTTIKAQKAVKHTMPRHLLNCKSNESNAKQQKLTKQQSSNSNNYLKDILPPPIMQSTKRPQSVNKAVKHTGGGSYAYYQSLNSKNTPNVKPFTQLNVNNIHDPSNSNNKHPGHNLPKTAPNSNKITMTTTYVYKCVSQQPEIDLNLECEEEDLVYVLPPVTPPQAHPIPLTSQTKSPEHPVETPLNSDAKIVLKEEDKIILDIEKSVNTIDKQESIDNSIENTSTGSKKQKLISRKSLIKHEEDVKKDVLMKTNGPLSNQPVTKIVKKNIPITQVTPNTKSTISGKTSIKNSSPALTAALENDSSDTNLSDSDENNSMLNTSNSDKRSLSKQNMTSKLESALTENSNKNLNSYANVLGKFYSRRNGSMGNALELAANDFEATLYSTSSKTSGKRTKHNSAISSLPPDLRVGNYPAKCNICNLILDNNIELTSHICSHLESSSSDPSGMSTYISPFDAVTTTCGVCDESFAQPFDLIKHLDQKHMKQLGEYKCRICELQHSKLSDLVAHLNQTHTHQEMPYRCDACGFRTSFYADAIYHIKKEHKNTLRHFCPYCLKSITLPFNEKIGYVQCQLFYSHLITHFNKHENDILQPSKCKHCQKCILHIRYMKDHLISDHSSIKTELDLNSPIKSLKIKKSSESPTLDLKPTGRGSSLVKTSDNKNKRFELLNTQAIKREVKSEYDGKKNVKSPAVNLRKRRRSARLDDELTADTNSTNSNLDSPANLYDFEDQIDEKFDTKEDLTESSTNETNESNRSKLFRKYTKGRKSASNSNPRAKSISNQLKTNQDTLLNKKARPNNSSESNISSSTVNVISDRSQFNVRLNSDQTVEVKTESTIKTENDLLPSPVKQPRRQKALKQTNNKNLSINSKYHKRRMLERNSPKELNYPPVPKSPEIITTILAGNIRFRSNKNTFKCVECNNTDLKTHFKNDYTCHQCKYNTNCSNSFEYHLHGHLVNKRVALWNKLIRIKTEEYKCPCGFILSSTKDNNSNANTGNKVAAHLMKCEYKYCNVSIQEDEKNDSSTQNEDLKALALSESELNEKKDGLLDVKKEMLALTETHNFEEESINKISQSIELKEKKLN